MGVLLLQILQWILRIILLLLLLMIGVLIIVLVVPIRYQAEGEFLEKKPGGRGKVTWFFYLIYMSFVYEEELRIQARVFGRKVFDSMDNTPKKEKKCKKVKKKKTAKATKSENADENMVEETDTKSGKTEDEVLSLQEREPSKEIVPAAEGLKNSLKSEEFGLSESVLKEEKTEEDELTVWEKEMEAEAKEESELAKQKFQQETSELEKQNLQQETTEDKEKVKQKKSLSEKIEDIKLKIQGILQKIKDIISKIKEGKLKLEHYLELWNRNETQITFGRAKTKWGRMLKAVLPRKWKLTGEIGFKDPCTTGQIMGVLGAMYPVFGNRVQVVPNFEEEIISVEGNVKGHIRLGNLLYQVVSLLLNRHCFKFIKMIFDEFGSKKNTKKSKKKKEL